MTNQKIAVWKDGDDNIIVIAVSGDVVESQQSGFSGSDFSDWPWDLDAYSNAVGEGIMVWEGEAFEEEDAEWTGTWRRPTDAELKELVVNGNPW